MPLTVRSKARVMPGKRITDHQVLKYKAQRRTRTQAAAAAKAGISERSARRHRIPRISSVAASAASVAHAPRIRWPRFGNPNSCRCCRRSPHLSAVTLLEELQRRYPGEYGPATLRTLQRRLRQLARNAHGGEREVFFAQEHPPGRQGLSDFTGANDLGVTIGGEPFAHLLYQFALAHSGWRSADVVEGGESFTALSSGLQGALWHLGGAPEEHRTDSLSAAFKNLPDLERRRMDQPLCRTVRHYGMRPSSQQSRRIARERQHRSRATARSRRRCGKRCCCAAIGDFDDRPRTRRSSRTIVQRMNARVDKRLATERASCGRYRCGARPSSTSFPRA